MAENQKSSRDRQGRWVKGFSGNPKGRPGKYANIDSGDFLRFKNTVREVTTPEGRIMMTREAAIQHRLYQSAMQGNVHAQIHLSRRFKQHAEEVGKLWAQFRDLVFRVKEEKREYTEAEIQWMNALRVHSGDLMPEAPKRRSRHKPKRKDGGSDPSVKS